jgi:hypothetical protein
MIGKFKRGFASEAEVNDPHRLRGRLSFAVSLAYPIK